MIEDRQTVNSVAWGGEAGSLTILSAVNACMRHWRLFVVLPIVVGGIAVALTLARPLTYTSVATVMPQGGSSNLGMSGLAARFGLPIPGTTTTASPEFYGMLLRSDGLLRQVARQEFEVEDPGFPGSTSVPALLGVEATAPALREELAVARLREQIETSVNKETGVVRLSVTTRWPELSSRIANELIELVHEFDVERRHVRGSAEVVFTEQRLTEAAADLEVAQDELTAFQRNNRSVQSSPDLLAESRRLLANLEFRQQVYLSLAQAFEQAKIEAVRNTPMVTVIDAPNEPAERDPRHLIAIGLLSVFLGLVLAVCWSITAEYLRWLGTERAPPAVEIRRTAEGIVTDLRRGPLGWLGYRGDR